MLTNMQVNVARLITEQGLPNKLIAARLGITDATVKVHVRRIMDRLKIYGVFNRVQLAIHCIKHPEVLEQDNGKEETS